MLDLGVAFIEQIQLLHLVFRADGIDHAPAFAQLLRQRGWDGIGLVGDDDGMKGRGLRPAIARAGVGVLL